MQQNDRYANGFCWEKLEYNDEMLRGVLPANRAFNFNTRISMGSGKEISMNAIYNSANLNSAVDGILEREIRGIKDATLGSE